MQNKILNELNDASKTFITLLLILTTFITHSIFLILFIITLILILFILADKSVNEYIVFIKKSIFILLFVFLIDIIIFKDINYIILCKLFISLVLAKLCSLFIKYENVANNTYNIITKLIRNDNLAKKIALSFSEYIYLMYCFSVSLDKINTSQNLKLKKKFGFKYRLLPRMLIATKKLETLKYNLNIKYFGIKKERLNAYSTILPVLFLILFVISIIKEVHL